MIRAILMVAAAFAAPMFVWAAGPTQGLAPDDVLRGRFVQERQLAGFKTPLKSEGHFVLTPGRGLIWDADKPFAVTTVITPEGLAQNVNGGQTMRLDSAKLPFIARLYDMLDGALAGDWSKMEADFRVSRTGTPDKWQVSMVPRNPDNIAMPFRSIDVTGGHFVDVIVLTKPDDDKDTLTLVDQTVAKAPLSPAEISVFDSARK